MSISTYRPLPAELREIQRQTEEIARGYGLDFYETIFEMLDYEELSMFAAYGGFPVRYSHWRFGSSYDELMKGYTYGLQKIYEMVINTDPCYAYLLDSNTVTDQKLVIAHVYGHCDFFKNNAWFAHTNRKMLDEMANHANRIARYRERFGADRVEEFIDACLSVEDLIDPHALPVRREGVATLSSWNSPVAREGQDPHRFPSKQYMDAFINPPELIAAEETRLQQRLQQQEASKSFPAQPQRDVLQFLLEHGQLHDWQRDVLSIIREEACYYAPQGQTKIMNEGWASYWHSTIMTQHSLSDAELIDYADHHSGTLATTPTRLNPYKLGIELFRDIEQRWNKGQFGKAWDECDDASVRASWDLQLGLGREKIFEVRKIHNDITFIDTFLTEEFCRQQKLFAFAYNSETKEYVIRSREFQAIKRQLLDSLTNHGRPIISVLDGNYGNRGELYLQHRYAGMELKFDEAEDTLQNLQQLWGRPVHLETVVDDHPTLLSFDGSEHGQQLLANRTKQKD